jgi:ABC-type bacteriocin/lantibiotic exporter with double-glycine peptidase domain
VGTKGKRLALPHSRILLHQPYGQVGYGQVTDLELENTNGMKLTDHCAQDKGLSVEMEDVSFSYPESNKQTLKNVSLNVDCSDRILIAGPNGSGKSTLLHIIAGLYDVQRGSIAYNGLPIGNLEMTSLRSTIGELLAEEQLFAGTLLDNITIGRTGATFENVRWAVKNLGLEPFIRQLPNGYQTYVSPEGKKLPKSIVQKILLARAIVDNPKLLLLEYAFELMDDKERKDIIDFITAPEHTWTIIAVSNDDYLARKLSRVALMEEGTVTQITDYLTAKTKINFKK